jgi:hypothetical protein
LDLPANDNKQASILFFRSSTSASGLVAHDTAPIGLSIAGTLSWAACFLAQGMLPRRWSLLFPIARRPPLMRQLPKRVHPLPMRTRRVRPQGGDSAGVMSMLPRRDARSSPCGQHSLADWERREGTSGWPCSSTQPLLRAGRIGKALPVISSMAGRLEPRKCLTNTGSRCRRASRGLFLFG